MSYSEKGKGDKMGEPENRAHGMDRRSFFKFSGLVAGGAFAGSALAGCGPKSRSEERDGKKSAGSSSAGTPAATSYAVYDADILLIGGGISASWAIREAAVNGQNILVVDKGPYGFSGAFGMNFDIIQSWSRTNPATEADVADRKYICNQTLYKKTLAGVGDESSTDVISANMGEIMSDRNEDGTPHYLVDSPTARTAEHFMTRHWSDWLRAKDFVRIHDRTMVTDLIVENGRCLGAVALHIPTGEYRVYRAKAVVSSTGGHTQFYGWNTTSPTTNNVPDNTADVEMSVLRHGGKIVNSEFGNYDLMGACPRGVAFSEGGCVGADSVHSSSLMDKNGTYLKDYPGVAESKLLSTQEGVMQAAFMAISQGNGSENGGIYLDCKPEALASMRWMYQRNAELMMKKFGYDVTSGPVEVIPEMYEHGGDPVTDENGMCVDFEGLFVSRSNGGDMGGSTNAHARTMGRYCMKKAIEYAKNCEEPNEITYESVASEIERLEDLRSRTTDDPIRPVKVRRSIQEACAEACRPYRPQDVLEKAQAELDRIMREDVPRMACADKSYVNNLDWKDAIETLNILDDARLTVAASLTREESRSALIRPEFPEKDDENWNCWLAFTRAEDGTLNSEKLSV